MVRYWKTQDSVSAKVTKNKKGDLIMKLEGEDFDFPTFPRGYLLYGPLSKLKHEIKNQVFNESWHKLDAGVPKPEVIKDIKQKLFGVLADIAETMKYDMLPPKSMTPSVREIYRAWTQVAPSRTYPLRDYLCFILQEDDGYRFRLQWLVKRFNPNRLWLRLFDPVKMFDKALALIEHAEVVDDMKERERLLRRILMLALEDPNINRLFRKLVREIDWDKVALTEADKYHFRGKYFKVDYPEYEY